MITSATAYHHETSYFRQAMKGHYLDWNNRPSVFKEYQGLKTLALPQPTPDIEFSLDQVLAQTPPAEPAQLTLEVVSRLLHAAYCLTAATRFQGEDFFYRNTPSAGALYPCELYLASHAVSGLKNGLFHYNLRARGLTMLREGDCLVSDSAQPFIMLFISVIFYRSAWKYRDRAYRYHLLDSGHLTESAALAAQALGLPFSVAYDFDDAAINRFLGVDANREGCLALVSIPAVTYRIENAQPLGDIIAAASCAAEYSVPYRLQEEMHSACQTIRPAAAVIANLKPTPDKPFITSFDDSDLDMAESAPPYHRLLSERRSKRNFIPDAMARQKLAHLLSYALFPSPEADLNAWPEHLRLGFIADKVSGLEPGIYLAEPSPKKIGLVEPGDYIESMTRICLDQNWLRLAATHFFIAADLSALDENRGPRGYRYAMLNAGRIGQRLYLGATALNLGCCGVGAFYDDEAAKRLNLGNSHVMLYLLAVGQVKK